MPHDIPDRISIHQQTTHLVQHPHLHVRVIMPVRWHLTRILRVHLLHRHFPTTLCQDVYKRQIVATGNIYEDVVQAQAAARQGADIIAVIRTTGQSLLDYVPYGATTEGFGGTFATQENFRIMRKALDEVSEEVGRYIRLCNYCSGLCMPEIAAMGALEGLDVMLNDALYGILFLSLIHIFFLPV